MKLRERTLRAMLCELELQRDFFGQETITTLYLGGGTPSLLEENELTLLFQAVNRNYDLSRVEEVTLEANPEDISKEKLRLWKNLGINRLSIGIQSFEDEMLKRLNRVHTGGGAVHAVNLAKEAGFSNISIDLIYGLPGLSEALWEKAINQALALRVTHISAYALTVEPRTALHHFVKSGKASLPPDEVTAGQFLELSSRLSQAGMEHYELSNFAFSGFRSRHNSAYWQRQPYLGIGPGAHSFKGRERSWNPSNNMRYCVKMEAGDAVRESECLSDTDVFNEMLMTGLRTAAGIEPENLARQFPNHAGKAFWDTLNQYTEEGLIKEESGRMWLTPEGWLLSDRIIAMLMA